MSKPLDFSKPVTTRDGRAVVIYTTAGANELYPIVGEIYRSGNDTVLKEWTREGRPIGYSLDSYYDLIQAPERIQREYWTNIYRKCAWLHDSLELASDLRVDGCLATVRVTIDTYVGAGLEE